MVKLNAKARITFLKHLLHENANKFGSTQEFLKFAILSNGFLIASQSDNLYRFILCTSDVYTYEGQGSDGSDTNFAIISHRYAQEDASIDSTYDNTLRLIRFLKPSSLQLQLNDGFPKKLINSYSKLFDALKAENFLKTRSVILLGHKQLIYANLIKNFSDRINELECDIELMIHETLFPKMKLDYYVARKLKNYEQIKQLMSRHKIITLKLDIFHQGHKAKKLKADILYDYFKGNVKQEIIINYGNDQETWKNFGYVRHLELEYRCHFYNAVHSIKQLKPLFYSLDSMKVSVVCDAENNDPTYLFDEMLKIYRDARQIQNKGFSGNRYREDRFSFNLMLRTYCDKKGELGKLLQKHSKFHNFVFLKEYKSADNYSLSNVFEWVDQTLDFEYRVWASFQSISDYDNEVRYHRLGQEAPSWL